MKRGTKLVGAAVIVVAAAVLGIVVFGRGAASPAEKADAVQTAAVQRKPLDVTAEASGTVEPPLVVEVKSRASGQVVALHAETGDEVKRGTLLAEIDPRDVRNALSQAQADIELARMQVQTATEQRKRSEELRKANIITEQEFEQARLAETSARAGLVKAQTNLELAQQKMGDVTIGAPIDGTIIEKTVETGQIIASASQTVSGGTTLFKMADLATMQVRALVDETDIGKVQPGQTARVTVEAYPGRPFIGQVQKIEPQAVVDQNVTMFPVLIRLDNAQRLLKPGMNAEVEVQIARRSDALVIPNDAVVNTKDAPSVGAALGLSEEQVRSALFNRPAPAGGAVTPAAQAGQPAGAAAGAQPSAQCTALRDKLRSGGGFESLSDADRAQLRACRAQLGFGGGRGGAGGFGGGKAAGNGATRRAVVFVSAPTGVQPRSVTLGVSDLDNTEVLSGVQPGEQVVLASALRLKQQQQDMQNQMKQRAGGMLGGAAPAGGGRRGR
ncbi:MAG TPA: efflux RND transporter periplasmic adaptor subunit [Longimicrobiales bacterium]|nr:efflux RND transporter periplasmic adaptor subunit [Longimicrobiales bacterium]